MKPEVQEELQPLFDQCIQDAIDGRITRLDSLWPPVVVSSEGAPFEVHALVRKWTEAQQAETLDAEKAIAFSENLRRQSRWGEIDYYLLDMLKRELQEKYFVVTGNEDDHFWDREYSLKPGIRAEEVPEPLLRFACYVAVSYKVYGLDFEYLDANYLFGLVEKVRPDMVKKLREHGTGKLPLSLQKRKTEHFTASANDAFAVIRITARDNTEECCREVLNYLCEILEQEDFPRSYAVEFKGPEKSYLPITGLPKKGVNQLFACAVEYPGPPPPRWNSTPGLPCGNMSSTPISAMSSARSPEVLPCSPWECWGKSGGSWYGIISISAMMSTPTYRKNSSGSM
ncbi:hypothetical protein CL3_01840 [butyrate-producing bacterium SM4/1]|nr:hypothetical protein CL3_01840 [butyrate-producing bacterium SM4/1]